MTSYQNRPWRFSVTPIGPYQPWNFQIGSARCFWNFDEVRDLSLSVCLSASPKDANISKNVQADYARVSYWRTRENGIVRLQTLPAIYCQQMHFYAFWGKCLAKTIVCG